VPRFPSPLWLALVGCPAAKSSLVEPPEPISIPTLTQDSSEPEPTPESEPPLTRAEIRTVVRAKLAQVRACFDEGLAIDPTLGGVVELGFTIDAEGRVSDAELLTDELAQARVGECLLEQLPSWQFPRPRGGAELRIRYPFHFTAEDTLRAAGLPRVEGTLDPSAVGQLFSRGRAELDACIHETGSSGGSVGVAFTIDDAGTVTKIASYASSLDDAAERCVLRTIASWTFPAAASDDLVKVNHDLSFE
jgi:hypothetical protein